MAKQVITKITDDIDGGDATETLTFGLDGMGYEIDLNAKNASKLRDLLSTYIEAGTRTGRIGSPAQLTRHRNTNGVNHPSFAANRELNQAIREWAGLNGYQLAERGRIPQHIVDAYHHGKPNEEAAARLAAEMLAPESAAPRKRAAKKATARI